MRQSKWIENETYVIHTLYISIIIINGFPNHSIAKIIAADAVLKVPIL